MSPLQDGRVNLWNSRSGNYLRTLTGSNQRKTWSVSMSLRGDRVALGRDDGAADIVEVASGHIRRLPGGDKSFLACTAFSPGDRYVATASADGIVRIWDSDHDAPLHTLPATLTSASALAFSPDEGLLATGTNNAVVELWDVASGRQIHLYRGHTKAITNVAFSRDGKLLASCGYDGTVRVWQVATGEAPSSEEDALLPPLRGNTGRVYNVTFSHDGRTVAAGGNDGVVRLWDVLTGRETLVLSRPGYRGIIAGLAFDAYDSSLVSVDSHGLVQRWDTDSSAAAPHE